MTELPDTSRYIKFLICARRKREDTQERYFYEWGNIHVSLMLTTPTAMKVFKRYVQHFSISGIDNDMLVYPLSAMEWDNMADHWLETYDDFIEALVGESYVKRMQPHRFGDKEFVLELARGKPLFEQEGFRPGGVKLTHWFKKKPSLSLDAFQTRWREDYAPGFLNAVTLSGFVRKYVQNVEDRVPPGVFKGTLFEHGGVGGYAGVEEIWFDSVESMTRLRDEPALRNLVRDGMAPLIDEEGSYAMVTTERVVYDFASPGEKSPRPAILDPNSLESRAIAQGYDGWNKP